MNQSTERRTKAPARRVQPQSDEAPRLSVRLPQDIYDQVARAAGAGDRSLNSEIIRRLRRSYAKDPGGAEE